MPRAGFETTISAGERTQSYSLDGVATGIGKMKYTRAVSKVSGHFEFLENLWNGFDVKHGSQSEDTLLCVREQSLSRRASQ